VVPQSTPSLLRSPAPTARPLVAVTHPPRLPNPISSTNSQQSSSPDPFLTRKASSVTDGPQSQTPTPELVSISPNGNFIGPQGETIHITLQNLVIGDLIRVILQQVPHG
jgi:hypothetical protein